MANGVYSATRDNRTLAPVPSTSRQRCFCGCEQRATHALQAGGCCMGTACEMFGRRWLKDPIEAMRARQRIANNKGK